MIGFIFQLAKTFLSRATETREEKHKLRMQKLKGELIASEYAANHTGSLRPVTAPPLPDRDGLLRWAAFLLFASPLIAGLVSPVFGERVLRAWHLLEPWQEKILSGMCLATFGVRAIPNMIGAIVDSIRRK